MAQPIAIADGIALAPADVCNTPAPSGTVPVPYPNIAQLADATGTSAEGGEAVYAAGTPILLSASEVPTSTGDEAGTPNRGKATFTSYSSSVFIHGKEVVRFGDTTSQNGGNAQGTVLSAPVTVLVGG